MCDPVSATLAAVSLGTGAYQQRRAGRDAQRAAQAQAATSREELARQMAFRDEASTRLAQTLGAVTPAGGADAQIRDALARREAAAAQSAPQTPSFAIAANGAPQIIRTAVNEGITRGVDDAAQKRATMAQLLAYGDRAFDTNLQIGRSGQELDQLSNMARVSNSVNDLERNAAGFNAQKGPSTLADALGGAAQIGLMMSLGGKLGGKTPKTGATKGPLNLMTGERM